MALLVASNGRERLRRRLVLGYAGALTVSGAHAAVRFRSLTVGVLEPPAVIATQAAYLAGFARGLLSR